MRNVPFGPTTQKQMSKLSAHSPVCGDSALAAAARVFWDLSRACVFLMSRDTFHNLPGLSLALWERLLFAFLQLCMGVSGEFLWPVSSETSVNSSSYLAHSSLSPPQESSLSSGGCMW